FWSLDLTVNESVLIPRADTEVLVEEVLAVADGRQRILDVGTGSGAVAIALASERPDFELSAIDLCPEALQVAKNNAEAHQLGKRIEFQCADLADLPPGPYDLVVSNPPYITSDEWAGLMPEVRDYEPRLALDGGEDGLTAYRKLTRQVDRIMAPGGWLLVEMGVNQAEPVAALFAAAGLTEIHTRCDYAGLPRVVRGRKV
ncbi:MAG: peptide chain release factor N(5)-glutamine methyltransferase, partial [Deltaproteobacteria bacterium]|nr:peptide chain release factor N(5)-glutamine methyltransferase [Deltaproteobacteria bacterium]